MKNVIKILCIALILSLMFSGCGKDEPDQPQDLESVRASLREKVASGKLTKEEAIVKLAEAEARLVSGDKDKAEYSPAIKALWEKLEERVAEGELTVEEAKTIWTEEAENVKTKAKHSPALKALSKKLKEGVAEGELTEEEAETIWTEAAENVKTKASAK